MKRRGFTLLETLVALALTGLLMVALNTFVFSMGELWGRNTDLRLFDQHVRAVTRFLERELHAAALPPAGVAEQAPIAVQEIRTQGGMTETLLTFELFEGSRIFSWPGQTLPEVVCSLSVREGTGLLFLWHSRLEKDFADQPPRETLVSPLVSALSYDYYDASFKNWKNEPAPRRNAKGEYEAPQRLRLKFTYRSRSQEVFLVLPTVTQGLPVF
ncbi:PilW family protein [Rariglobus hedericola]|uniref:Prepilin-type N-terminal cleavage/methylation domain-containing protein n=1 Tax=Rariglobus hedericola TaxID=2597822 RepID=A0A556QJT5_9BACT|nr:prepilin-type N-terminal cleavage/methylation domain-containing protein [Rariglobus hedericola]TSJ76871.1 prepilin-type N-terminal cleavage/methylation domain-containing protein [Rariglobus hedericola]